MAAPAATEWRSSEVEEFKSHVLNGTFGPACDIPKGQYAVPLDWVYKLERCGRYKVRVVIRGYLMRAGLHFNQTFSPTPQARSVRTIMALAAKHGYALTLHDVKTAFLTAELDTVLYVRLPPAFNDNLAHQAQAEPSATVHLCHKAIPGCPREVGCGIGRSTPSSPRSGSRPSLRCLFLRLPRHRQQTSSFPLGVDDYLLRPPG